MKKRKLIVGVYSIRNKVNNCCYIGSSKDNVSRWRKHKSLLRGGRHYSQILQKEWSEYGEDNFEFYILEFCNKEDLILIEQRHLDEQKPLYNTSPSAGSPRGLKRSLETRLKQSRNHGQLGKLGKNSIGHKEIYQYDLNGTFLKLWYGAGEIKRELGFDPSFIRKGCRRKTVKMTPYGFFWSREFLGEKISPIKIRTSGAVIKRVGCFDDEGNIVKEFESKKEACLYFGGIKEKKINNSIYYNKKCHGYNWKYL
jgi:group I intron endonuclease